MTTTNRFGLRYPAGADAFDIPTDMGELATDVDGWLSRAFPCLSTARPTGIADGFIIRETDTGLWWGYNGTTWVSLGASGGDGGAVLDHAQFSGSAQSIPHATNTPVAFGTTDTASAVVTRQTRGAGHQFVLGRTGLWSITATVRYATTAAVGERYAGIHTGSGGGDPLAGDGKAVPSGNPVTCSPSLAARWFTSGSIVFVNAYQGTGGSRNLEPHGSGGWVRINLACVS